MSALPAREQVRLAELLAALSLGSDLGMGLPMEHVLRQCLIAIRLAVVRMSTYRTASSCITRHCWRGSGVISMPTSRQNGSATIWN